MQQNGAGQGEAARSARARFALVTVLIVALLVAASGYLFLPEQAATLVVLACIGILSTVGVVALFGVAAGMLGLKSAPGLPASSGDPAQAFRRKHG